MRSTILTVIFCFWAPVLAIAQRTSLPEPEQGGGSSSDIRFGARVGGVGSQIVSSVPVGSWLGKPSLKGHGGYVVGAVVEFRLARMFSIQPELLVALKGLRQEGDVEIVRKSDGQRAVAYEIQRQDLTYLELPVNFVLKVPVGRGGLNIAAGPYVAYGVSGNLEAHFYQNGVKVDSEIDSSSLKAKLFTGSGRIYRPWDFGLNAMVGWEFGIGLFVDLGYSHSMTTIAADRRYNDRNSALFLSAGYKF